MNVNIIEHICFFMIKDDKWNVWRWPLLLNHLFHFMCSLVPSSRANPGGIKKTSFSAVTNNLPHEKSACFCKWINKYSYFAFSVESAAGKRPHSFLTLSVVIFEYVWLWSVAMALEASTLTITPPMRVAATQCPSIVTYQLHVYTSMNYCSCSKKGYECKWTSEMCIVVLHFTVTVWSLMMDIPRTIKWVEWYIPLLSFNASWI